MTEREEAKGIDAEAIEAAFAPAMSISEPLPRERVLGLLERMTRQASDADAAGRVLEVLGRMAACSWVEGQLAVVVKHTETGVDIDLLAYDGLSYTRIAQPLPVRVSLDEFVRLVVLRGGTVGALGLLFDEPGVEIQLAAFEQPVDSVAMPDAMPEDEEPLSKRSTMRLAAVSVPLEATPQGSDPRAARVETDLAVTRPGSYSIKPSGGTDDGRE